MRVRSVGHACLEIEAEGLRIVTDPWWTGPAYTGQWHPWPTPRPDGLEQRPIDYLYLSHGHEDHLHPDTLKTLRPGAVALVPQLVSGGMADYLRSEFGFAEVIELKHGVTVPLRNGVLATCYVNVSDSTLVLEAGGQVLVDGNDALHASPRAVIESFCRTLKKRHRRIDQLYLGFGGASWFPNCFRVPGKNDREAACAREQSFVENFLRATELLEPKVACAFAASFVLLDEPLRWINEVKFDMPTPDVEYQRRGPRSQTRVHLLLPNDVIDGARILPSETPRPSRASFAEACATTFRDRLNELATIRPLTDAELQLFVQRLDFRMRDHAKLAGKSKFTVELRLRSNPTRPIQLRIDGRRSSASLEPAIQPDLVLELRPEILDAALTHDYGVESIFIGYGAVAKLREPAQLANVQKLVAMLSPRAQRGTALVAELRRNPSRVIEALWLQVWPLAAWVGTRLGLLPKAWEPRALNAKVGGEVAA